MNCDHLYVHVRKNKRYEERAVSLDLIRAGVCSTITCIGYFCHLNITFIILLTIDVSWSTKLFQAKKFMVQLSWERIEAGSYCTINNIYENFSALRLRIEVSKLHV